ncbi:CD276 antigen homolog [Colossoma macropomum]|uniref:CD276 antigen homolog n=1 Tax=Colossoma macropomum TaxID=42526 RepID=UPI001864E473|nr:CD276 antigen homolog [Colossoma macropomum]
MTRLRLSQRCWFSCVLLLLIDKVSISVSLQGIEAGVGKPVILPCSNSDEPLQDKVTVFWRFRDSRTVYDIIDSEVLFDEQDTSFRHRVESFPAEWTKGNFSITLSSVQKADGGLYICFIPAINKQTKVQLIVQERPVAQMLQQRDGDVKTAPALSVRGELRNRDAGRKPENLVLFSAALLGLTLLYV